MAKFLMPHCIPVFMCNVLFSWVLVLFLHVSFVIPTFLGNKFFTVNKKTYK